MPSIPATPTEPHTNLVREPAVSSAMSVWPGDGGCLTGNESPVPPQQPQHKSTLSWTPLQPDDKQQQKQRSSSKIQESDSDSDSDDYEYNSEKIDKEKESESESEESEEETDEEEEETSGEESDDEEEEEETEEESEEEIVSKVKKTEPQRPPQTNTPNIEAEIVENGSSHELSDLNEDLNAAEKSDAPSSVPNEAELMWWEQPADRAEEEEEEEKDAELMWWEQPAEDTFPQSNNALTSPVPWWEQSEDAGSNNDLASPVPWWEQSEDARAWSPGSPIFKKDVLENMKVNSSPQPPPPPPPPKKSKDGGSGPPTAPPMPPPPPGAPPPPKIKKPVSPVKKQKLDQIKKAARSRPDWNTLLRDIEGGIKLRRLPSCDKMDRSSPMLPNSRGKGGKFVYESEKPIAHNELLIEIHRGVKLRKAKTNDRSKPCFKTLGLKKLRRQCTMENINKLENMPSSSDEEEDIDKMRDDLQATKSQLEEEVKRRRKLEREMKIDKIDKEGLQAEVKRLKRQLKMAGITDPKPMTNGEADEIVPKLEKSMSKLRMHEDDAVDFDELDNLETEINNLKTQVDSYKKQAEDHLNKYTEATQKLIVSENSSDEWEQRCNYYEKKYKALQKDRGIELPDIETVGMQTDPIDFTPPPPPQSPTEDHEGRKLFPMPSKSGSRRSFASSVHKMESFKEEDESEEEEEEETEDDESEEEEEEEEEEIEGEDEEKAAERRARNEARRKERDIRLSINKLNNIKTKEKRMRDERKALRQRIDKNYTDMKGERELYFKTKRELDEMASGLKSDDDEGESDSEDEEDDEDEEEEIPRKKEEGEEWWLDDTTKKPIKLKRRRRSKFDENGEEEDSNEKENAEELPEIKVPVWNESEQEDSEADDEHKEADKRLSQLKNRIHKHEQKFTSLRKENSNLKTQVERSDEMVASEKRKRQRQDEELHIMLSEMS